MADLSFTVDVPVLVWGQMSLVVGVIAVMIVYWMTARGLSASRLSARG